MNATQVPTFYTGCLLNILDREVSDLAEEWNHLTKEEQVNRLSDLCVMVRTIKQTEQGQNI